MHANMWLQLHYTPLLVNFSYTYILEVDGKSLKRFVENRKKACRTWLPKVSGRPHRVVLGKKLF